MHYGKKNTTKADAIYEFELKGETVMVSKEEKKAAQVNEKPLDEEDLEQVSGGGIQISDFKIDNWPEDPSRENPMNVPRHFA